MIAIGHSRLVCVRNAAFPEIPKTPRPPIAPSRVRQPLSPRACRRRTRKFQPPSDWPRSFCAGSLPAVHSRRPTIPGPYHPCGPRLLRGSPPPRGPCSRSRSFPHAVPRGFCFAAATLPRPPLAPCSRHTTNRRCIHRFLGRNAERGLVCFYYTETPKRGIEQSIQQPAQNEPNRPICT